MTTLTRSEATALFRDAPERWIDVGNGEVAYRTVGTGPDVLFVHGWPASGATYRGLLPHLSPHMKCHVLDLVGAGDSRFDRSVHISIEAHAEAVRRVVDELELSDVAVVGHDSGGMIARYALADDPRVRSWALVDTEQPQGAHWRFSSFLAIRYLPGFEKVLAGLVNRPRLRRNKFILGDAFRDRSLIDGEFAEFFLTPLENDPDRQWATGEFARNFDLGALKGLGAVHARMTAPVQLIWGEDDPFFPLDWTKEMMSGFSGQARLHVIDGGKLFVHEEFPEQTARAHASRCRRMTGLAGRSDDALTSSARVRFGDESPV